MTTSLTDIRLVAADIDGTLTHQGTIKPSSYTIDVIERLHRSGILFGLASGRDAGQLKELKNAWGLSFDPDLLIGLNGSEYLDGRSGQRVVLHTLEPQDIKQIITKMLERFPDLNCSIYRNGMRLLRYEDEQAVFSSKRDLKRNLIVDDLSLMWKECCPKVMFRVSEEVMKQIEPYAAKLSNDRFRSLKTQSTMLEFVHARADKGNALSAYCRQNDIDIARTAAFGDMENDLELLKTAGWGVCMINGSPAVKEAGDDITEFDNDNDGCARYIEERILKAL